jgi:hypothetical protein
MGFLYLLTLFHGDILVNWFIIIFVLPLPHNFVFVDKGTIFLETIGYIVESWNYTDNYTDGCEATDVFYISNIWSHWVIKYFSMKNC